MHHYELGYHDQQNETQTMCEYAHDAFEAVKFAREDEIGRASCRERV